MKNVQFEDWVINVQYKQTTAFYEKQAFEQQLEVLNFVQVSSFGDFEVQQFLEQFGIDMLKPSALNYFSLEDGTVMYSGCYYVFGQIEQGQLDNWDVVIGQHCFSLTMGNSDVPEELVGQVFEISFEVVLPWLLEEPLAL